MLRTLLCKKIIFAKFKELKAGCNLAESSDECYGTKMDICQRWWWW
jgi:hypothetical protein